MTSALEFSKNIYKKNENICLPEIEAGEGCVEAKGRCQVRGASAAYCVVSQFQRCELMFMYIYIIFTLHAYVYYVYVYYVNLSYAHTCMHAYMICV